MSLDRAALHRLQKPWLDVANATRYSPGVRPSIIDVELPQDKRKGEIVQVLLLLLLMMMMLITFTSFMWFVAAREGFHQRRAAPPRRRPALYPHCHHI
jgi:hypothetical protein